MKKKAVFLDRDGTLNRDVGYPDSFESIHVYPFGYEAVRLLNRAHFLAVIVTNQSGIARGLISEERLSLLHDQMKADFHLKGARIDAIYACPHSPSSLDTRYKKECPCRKPLPAMGLAAAADLNIDLSRSYMIGDKTSDILFGLNMGATPVLVRTGYGHQAEQELLNSGRRPAFAAETLLQAVFWILDREGIHRDRGTKSGQEK